MLSGHPAHARARTTTQGYSGATQAVHAVSAWSFGVERACTQQLPCQQASRETVGGWVRCNERCIRRCSWFAQPPIAAVITSVIFAVQVGVTAGGCDAHVCHAGKRAGVQKACLQGAGWHSRGGPAAFHESIPLFPWKCLTKLRDTDLSQQTLPACDNPAGAARRWLPTSVGCSRGTSFSAPTPLRARAVPGGWGRLAAPGRPLRVPLVSAARATRHWELLAW
eukprot:scaffold31348_cov59-Phaeocystis_antarctica.AAC.1